MANQTLHMKPNVAAAIAYVFGWLSGLIVFFLEKENRYVRFHAIQSILVSGIFTVLSVAINFVLGWLFLARWLLRLLSLLFFIIWLICIVRTATYRDIRIPFLATIADVICGSTIAWEEMNERRNF